MVILGRCCQWVSARLSVMASGAALLLVLACCLPWEVQSRESPHATAADVHLQALPAQARETHRLIQLGGPFPYAKDGVVFGNRERQLPKAKRGYYREYTVKTPGSSDRGARRIVCGGQVPQRPDVCYYTQDHYASFRRIAP